MTPLHLASRVGSLEIVELLIKHNANIHVRNNRGLTAFQEASAKKRRNVMQLLLEHGAENVVG